MRFVLPLLLICGFFGSQAFADGEINQPIPAGIIFPGFQNAPNLNPAEIATENAVAGQGLYMPKIWGGDVTGYGGSMTGGFGNFGLAADYATFSPGSSAWNLAGAFHYDSFSLGTTVSSQSGSNTSVGLGLLIGSGDGLQYGGVLSKLTGGGTQADLGIGYGEKKKYNLEFNLQLPPFNDLSGTYGFTVAGAIYAGIFGVSYAADASVVFGKSFSVSHNVSLLVQAAQKLLITLSFIQTPNPGLSYIASTTSNGPTFGLTYVF